MIKDSVGKSTTAKRWVQSHLKRVLDAAAGVAMPEGSTEKEQDAIRDQLAQIITRMKRFAGE